MDSRPVILPQCLTVAGSDSGGGAGIQADLKTFAANGVYGLSVITSVTAQNTRRLLRAFELPAEMVRLQLAAVFEDFEVAAAKTGMLASAAIVRALASFWRSLPQPPLLVVDPVMATSHGDSLLEAEALESLRQELIPLATLVTPNRQEAERLSGLAIRDRETLQTAGRRILELGPQAVLIKGGHLPEAGGGGDRATDYLFRTGGMSELSAPRLDGPSPHGTGCTLSAAICAWLARGLPLAEAAERAKSYTTDAIRARLGIGRGEGPTDHFHFLDRSRRWPPPQS